MFSCTAEILYTRYRSPELGPQLLMADTSGDLLACVFAPEEASPPRPGSHTGAPALRRGFPARLANRLGPRPLREADVFGEHIAQLEQYLAGARREFTVPLALHLATPFQTLVLEHLAGTLPFGATTTYSQVAADIGRPTASRAVGMALGANPLCVFLPCHRVLGAGGNITGYAGGVEVKEHLLQLEGSLPEGPFTQSLPVLSATR